jgi:DNA polymerase-3 subunit beta
MKFRCERDTLAEAIGTAQRAVASRTGALPVLSGLRCTVTGNTVELIGSDLELTIKVEVAAAGEGDGKAVLPARLFSDIVRSVAGSEVQVDVDAEEARITSGRSSFSLRTLPVDDFPRVSALSEAGVRVDAAAFADALRQVVPAASRDDARPILTGVLLTSTSTGLRLVATDSYRLAVRDLPGVSVLAEGQKVLVPAKSLGEVQRLLGTGDVEVVLAEREVAFRVAGTEITTRLIEGEFPNYEQLIPSGYPNRLTINGEALAEAIKRVRIVGQGGRDSSPIRCAMTNDGIEVSAVAQEVGEAREFVDAKFEGTELTAAFNSEFLLDGCHAMNAEELVLETVDPLKPATLKATDNNDFLYLLMPVRVS